MKKIEYANLLNKINEYKLNNNINIKNYKKNFNF